MTRRLTIGEWASIGRKSPYAMPGEPVPDRLLKNGTPHDLEDWRRWASFTTIEECEVEVARWTSAPAAQEVAWKSLREERLLVARS